MRWVKIDISDSTSAAAFQNKATSMTVDALVTLKPTKLRYMYSDRENSINIVMVLATRPVYTSRCATFPIHYTHEAFPGLRSPSHTSEGWPILLVALYFRSLRKKSLVFVLENHCYIYTHTVASIWLFISSIEIDIPTDVCQNVYSLRDAERN